MKTIIANWKMNPQTLDEAKALFEFTIAETQKYPNIQTIICSPFVFVEELSKSLKAINSKFQNPNSKFRANIGAQDIFWEQKGAFTGEISAEMLKNFGVSHVLIGHSDRRYTLGETDEVVNKKIKAALTADIAPILLVGERQGEDREQTLEKQLSIDLSDLSTSDVDRILIAYEPVWAISTNPNAKPDTPENTLESLKFIKGFLATNFQFSIFNFQLLYGGSINEKNVTDFLKHPEIGGAVIGGASLRKEEFGRILKLISTIAS